MYSLWLCPLLSCTSRASFLRVYRGRHFAIDAAESSNYVQKGRIPQFDYILRISSLINTKHRYIYTNKGRNLERRRAKWQFVLEGFLSMDAHYCSLRNFEYAIPIPPLFFVLSSTCQFLSLLIFPLLIYPLVRSLPEFSRGSLKDNRSNRLIRKLSFPRLSPFISPINERLEGFRNFFFLLRAFYYLSDFPNFLNFLRKKLFSIPRSIIATLFDQISDDVRIHGCIRKMFIWKPRLSMELSDAGSIDASRQ